MAVLYSFIGSSAASMMLEEMIASGARRVLEVGLCGGLVSSLKAGDYIVVDEAFVDEGTSSHYHKNPIKFPATTNLRKPLEQVLENGGTEFRMGGVWTTDAPYRETRKKLLVFTKRGALGVNMESSALFAVGKYRHIEVASLQVVSDLLGASSWRPSFHEKKVAERSIFAAAVALEALAGFAQNRL
jgi:uridine phosphorylase